jgi:hypothetical protein
MRFHFIRRSDNQKTGPIPQTYSERATCPPSCAQYRDGCYAEDYYTRLNWDRVPERGGSLAELCEKIRALPAGQLWRHNVAGDLPGIGESVDPAALGEIVLANRGRRGFTYTHKHSPDALQWAAHATAWGFTVNLSADTIAQADTLAPHGPTVCIVPIDHPERSSTPQGRPVVVCPAQTRDTVTCESCGLCARPNRAVIVAFRAHGSRKRTVSDRARIIPITKA